MSIEVVTTPYGPPAHEALARAVEQAKAGDPLAPVTVVVPSNYVGLAARRALGRRRHNGTAGLAAVAFDTTYKLAEHLGGAEMAGQGRRGVSSAVIAAAVRAALRRDPGHFRGVETHPATERALTRAHRELSELDHGQLAALAGQSLRARDVVRIHREVGEALEPDFSNEQQLAQAAASAVRARPSETQRRLGRVIVFLPQSVTGSQARLLRAVSDVTATTVVVGATGAEDADAAVRASLRRLGADLDSEPERPGGSKPGRAADGVRALSVSDADDEVRHAVRAVVDAARAGTPLGRCAIVYGVESPYVRLVGDALDAAGIERCGATVRTAETSLLGRSLMEMLALPDRGFSRRAVTAWLAGAPVSIKQPDPGTERPNAERGDEEAAESDARSSRWQGAPSAAWERAARAARVDAGIDSWKARLGRYVADCLADAERFQADEDQVWRGERLRRDAARAADLLGFVEELHRRPESAAPAPHLGRLGDLVPEPGAQVFGRAASPELARRGAGAG